MDDGARPPVGDLPPVVDDLGVLRSALAHAEARGHVHDAEALRRALRYVQSLRRQLPPQRVRPVRQLEVSCFGTFEVLADGEPLSLAALRPRARAVLRLLAMHAGRPVHRERLLEALWPDTEPVAAGRSLQTAVSSLRALLHGAGSTPVVARDGETYALGAQVRTDVARVERALALGARRGQPVDDAVAAWSEALDLYGGELLAEDGPAEWVVEERAAWQVRLAAAAQSLGDLELARGRPTAAARAARRGLQVDRLADGLWRLLVTALQAAGDVAAAAAARREYDEVLAGLLAPVEPRAG